MQRNLLADVEHGSHQWGAEEGDGQLHQGVQPRLHGLCPPALHQDRAHALIDDSLQQLDDIF